MSKIYVLDTNVLVQAPGALLSFEENEVVLPLVVVEELDNLKKEEGVETPEGGRIRIERNYLDTVLSPDLAEYKSDNRILKTCVGLNREADRPVILVTKDILLRIKAQLLGVRAEDFAAEQVGRQEEQYSGRTEVYAPDELFREFKKKGIPAGDVYQTDEAGQIFHPALVENQFVIIRSDQSEKKPISGGWRTVFCAGWTIKRVRLTE